MFTDSEKLLAAVVVGALVVMWLVSRLGLLPAAAVAGLLYYAASDDGFGFLAPGGSVALHHDAIARRAGALQMENRGVDLRQTREWQDLRAQAWKLAGGACRTCGAQIPADAAVLDPDGYVVCPGEHKN